MRGPKQDGESTLHNVGSKLHIYDLNKLSAVFMLNICRENGSWRTKL